MDSSANRPRPAHPGRFRSMPCVTSGMAPKTAGTLPSPRKSVRFYSGDLKILLYEKLAPLYRDIWLVGGAMLGQRFRELGLVNEIRLTVAPILFGGLRLFAGSLTEERWPEERGCVQQRLCRVILFPFRRVSASEDIGRATALWQGGLTRVGDQTTTPRGSAMRRWSNPSTATMIPERSAGTEIAPSWLRNSVPSGAPNTIRRTPNAASIS